MVEGIFMALVAIVVSLLIGCKMTKKFRDSLKVDKS